MWRYGGVGSGAVRLHAADHGAPHELHARSHRVGEHLARGVSCGGLDRVHLLGLELGLGLGLEQLGLEQLG